jgi:hypothetical protein
MITDTQFHALLAELIGIRHALEARQTSLPQASTPAPKSTATRTPDSLPMPTTVIERAGEVPVHFGKNAGTPISQLNDKQLLWYGADREPQLKKDGTPFPPRDADVLLQNAVRTLWHERQGNLPSSAPAIAVRDQAPALAGDEEVPF